MIDLAMLDRLPDPTRMPHLITYEEVAALVRLARAARAYQRSPHNLHAWIPLCDALAAFTDSAEQL